MVNKALAILCSLLILAFVSDLPGSASAPLFGASAIPLVQVAFPVSTGNLDSTFGSAGTVVTGIGSISDVAQAVAMQADGKIVVAGASYNGSINSYAVVRYNPNGSLDSTFGVGGIVLTAVGSFNSEAYGLAIQSDGKIVVAGQANNFPNTDFAVVRYNTDGSLDTAFHGDGRVVVDIAGGNDTARSVAIQPDGKIIVAGSGYNGVNSDIALIRLETNGSLDVSFNPNSATGSGKVLTPIGTGNDTGNSVLLQPDGRIIVAGFYAGVVSTDSVIVRYNAAGVLDTTFSGDGIAGFAFSPVDVDEALAMALQPDGKIVVTGCIRGNGRVNDYLIARINSDGSLDPGFGSGGFTFVPFSNAPDISYGVGLQPDGKIVAAGFANNGVNNDFGVTRVDASGAVDTSFAADGRRLIEFGGDTDFANGMVIQADGKIVVVGRTLIGGANRFAIARLGYGTNPGGNDGFFDLDPTTAIRFDNAFLRGTSSVNLLDPTAAPAVLPGWSFVGSPKDIQTTAQFSGNNLIRFTIPGNIGQAAFDAIRVYQYQNGVWTDRTAASPQRDYATRSVYASVSSLGILAAALPSAYAPTLVTVSGRVTSPTGRAVRNAIVTIIDENNDRRIAITNPFGIFIFQNVVAGRSYTLETVSKRYSFAPRTLSVTDNAANIDFVGFE